MKVTHEAAKDRICRLLPQAARPYARLMRLDRPIGTWLLLLPCWWGAALAGPFWPSARLLLLFAVGALVLRGAGCVINDLWDRHLDAKVERTRSRPLACGDLTPRQALVFLALLLAVGAAVLAGFSQRAGWVALLAMPLVVLYPLAKRVTFWPQFVLGLTFNWGVWVAFAELRAWPFGGEALLLYAGGVFWTLAYDTIYAVQDRKDDVEAGVKSTALLFGARVQLWVAGFFDMAMILLLLAGWQAGLGWGFYALMAAAYGQACWQVLGWRTQDAASSLLRFRSNRDWGVIVFAAILAGRATG